MNSLQIPHAESYFALRDLVGYVTQNRDVVRVAGPDALKYLDGQLSQDISKLGPGEAAWTFLLQPNGKVAAYCRIFAISAEHFILEAPVGWGDVIADRLRRFWLRVDCEISQEIWMMRSYRGAQLSQAAEARPEGSNTGEGSTEGSSPEIYETPTLKAGVLWGDAPGFDLLALQLGPPTEAASTGAIECSRTALDVLRVEAGVPKLGKEIMTDALPAEIGDEFLHQAVSFTKGCYVGQELVERMQSRGGGPPKRLLGIKALGDGLLAHLSADGAGGSDAADLGAADFQLYDSNPAEAEAEASPKPKAQLTSLAQSPDLGQIGLALVHRSVNPSDVLFTAQGDQVKICSLPLRKTNLS